MKKTLTCKSLRKGKRKCGFRARMATSQGRHILRHRRRKGKKRLTV